MTFIFKTGLLPRSWMTVASVIRKLFSLLRCKSENNKVGEYRPTVGAYFTQALASIAAVSVISASTVEAAMLAVTSCSATL